MRNLWLLFLVGLATASISDKLFVFSQSSTAEDLYIEGNTSGDLPIDDEDGENDGSGSGSGDYAFEYIDKDELLRRFNLSKTSVSKEMLPLQPQPTADSPHNTPTTAAETTVDSETPVISYEDSDEKVPGIGPTADWFTQTTSSSSNDVPPGETTTADFSMDISVTTETSEDNSLDRWDVTTVKEEVVIKEIDNEIYLQNGRGSRLHEINSPEEVTSENLWERTEVLAAVIACGVVGFLCAVFLLMLLAYRMKKKDEGSYDLGDTKLSTTAYHKAPTKEFYA